MSSVIANSAIYPSDLVDSKLSTVWNSRTEMSRAVSQLQGNLLAVAMTASSAGGWWTSYRSWIFEQL